MTKLMGIYKGAAKNGQCVVYMHADQSVLREKPEASFTILRLKYEI